MKQQQPNLMFVVCVHGKIFLFFRTHVSHDGSGLCCTWLFSSRQFMSVLNYEMDKKSLKFISLNFVKRINGFLNRMVLYALLYNQLYLLQSFHFDLTYDFSSCTLFHFSSLTKFKELSITIRLLRTYNFFCIT